MSHTKGLRFLRGTEWGEEIFSSVDQTPSDVDGRSAAPLRSLLNTGQVVEEIEHLADKSPANLKKRLRAAMVRRIDGMGLPSCAEASERIRRHLVEMPEVRTAHTLLLFACDATEPDLVPLASAEYSWQAVFPRVAGGGKLEFFLVESPEDQLVPGTYGLREPDPNCCTRVDSAAIDVVMAPGRAFSDETGARLGRGGGFYDRLLADLLADVSIFGVCFRCQVIDKLPTTEKDVPVQKIVTEAGVITA